MVALQPPHWHMRAAHAFRYSGVFSRSWAMRVGAESKNDSARTKSPLGHFILLLRFDEKVFLHRLDLSRELELPLRGNQGDDGAEENHDRAEPDPAHQGFHEDLDRGLVVVGDTGEDHVQVLLESRVAPHLGGGLLAREVEVLLGREGADELSVLCDLELRRHPFVVLGSTLVEPEELHLIAPDVDRLARYEVRFLLGIEGGAGDSDEDEDHAEMHHVATIAPGIDQGQIEKRSRIASSQ